MKSRFFSKADELVLSTATALVVMGLVYQGLFAWFNGREHAIFKKSYIKVAKK